MRCLPRKTGGCTRMWKMRREKPSSVPRLKPGRGEMLPCVPSLGFSPSCVPKKALLCTTFTPCTPRKPAPCTNGQSPAAPRVVQRAAFLGTPPPAPVQRAAFLGTPPPGPVQRAAFLGTGPPDSVQWAAFLGTSPPAPVQRAAFLGAPLHGPCAPPLLSTAHGVSHDANDHDTCLETP